MLSPDRYIQRSLTFVDDNGRPQSIEDEILPTETGSKVILGEPGIGKSELVEMLAKNLGVEVVAASTLVWRQLEAADGKFVVIDGLDELTERLEGQALGKVLERLQEANWPNFILSCRAADWDLRGEHDLSLAPVGRPRIYSLKPLSTDQARQFLEINFPDSDPTEIIEHLGTYDLQDLMGNPLTLGLIGEVAAGNFGLPNTKGELFEQAARILVSEQSQAKITTVMSQQPDAVLDSACALCAVYLLTGSAAISRQGDATSQQDDLRVSYFETLPDGRLANEALKTRIFRPVGGPERFVPLHRVIAEFLGARWLSSQLRGAISKRRLLSLLTSRGVVPASLRGIFAWLAYHSARLSEDVIRTDPYGVLRYADIDCLSDRVASKLFDSLRSLSETNPFFRAGDWSRHPVSRLIRKEFQEEIAGILSSTDAPVHLRILFAESLEGAPIVGEIKGILHEIVRSSNHCFAERNDIAEALWRVFAPSEKFELITDLQSLGDEDSTRLAVSLLEASDFEDVGVDLFCAVLLADAGLTLCRVEKGKRSGRLRVRYYEKAAAIIPDGEISNVIKCLSPYLAASSKGGEHDGVDSIARIVLNLAYRRLCAGETNVVKIWDWLSCLCRHYGNFEEYSKEINGFLQSDTPLRRRLLSHIAFEAADEQLISNLIFIDGTALSFLVPSREDTEWLIHQMASMENREDRLRERWRHFLSWHARGKPLDKSLRPAARKFAGHDEELRAYLKQAIRPKKPDWQKQQERRRAAYKRQQKRRYEKIRESYLPHLAEIEGGGIYEDHDRLAKVYLGLCSDLRDEDGAINRLEKVYGAEITPSILEGFEATLFRDDLPDALAASELLANGSEYFCFRPIIAGLLERLRSGKGLNGIPEPTLKLALRIAQESWLFGDEFRSEGIQEVLEGELLSNGDLVEEFLRIWIEPALVSGLKHGNGLYRLKSEEVWFEVSAPLAREWLISYPEMVREAQGQLIELLTNAGRRDLLLEIVELNADAVLPNFDSLMLWLSVDYLVSFKKFMENAQKVCTDVPDFLWHIRDRTHFDKTSQTMQLSAQQLHLIVSEFRSNWPNVDISERAIWGDRNAHDASEFIRRALESLSKDTSDDGRELLQNLVAAPKDSYTDHCKFSRSNQLQQWGEASYEPPDLPTIRAVVTAGRPKRMEDFCQLVLDVFDELQAWLKGDETTPVRRFWPNNLPLAEEEARDLSVNFLRQFCLPLDVELVTEKRMLRDKRADLILQCGAMQLPVEAKGQWHSKVWDAANDQLDRLYTDDPRGHGRGLYLVFWYGPDAPHGKKLKVHPDKLVSPKTALQMREMILERIPEHRRMNLDVIVLDLTV